MCSIKFLATLSLFLGFFILVAEIRPSSSMPIEGGDKNNDKYQGIYDLITERLRNLSQINQGDDENFRKSFVPATTNKSDVKNTTVLLRNATQEKQINDQNSRRSYVPMVAGYTRNLVPGNPPGNQMAGNQMAGNQMAGNQMAGNQIAGNSPAGNSPAPNSLAGNSPAGNLLAGNSPAGNQLAGNQPAGSPSSFGTDNTNQAFTNYLTNAEQTGASMFPTSSIAGRFSHEDRSGIFTNVYRPPSTNDRKNTIYRQNSPTPNYYGRGNGNSYYRISPPSSDVRKTGVITPDQYTRSYQNYPQQMGYPGAPNYQQYSSYPRYPGYQQQQWRRGYPASPGYQANYPGMLQQRFYPTTKEVRDRVPIQDKKWSVPSSSEDNENNIKNKFDHTSSPKPTTIQRKLPENPVRKSTSPRIQSSPEEDIPSSSSGSGYDRGYDEPADMDDTADLQESQEFSGSGSGYAYGNEDLNGDTSNVAFMLAGTNHDRDINSPSFPMSVLPMNLTRQQAIDIYRSALYFAGLLQEGNINGDTKPLTTLQRPKRRRKLLGQIKKTN